MNEGYLTNHFLVSMPHLMDDNFARTVTLICHHDADGAMGIVINRLTSHNLGEIFHHLDIGVDNRQIMTEPVFEGGPVRPEIGMVVHSVTPNQCWECTLGICEDLAVTCSYDILEDMARGDGPEHYLMSLGYSGWGPGQLEQEILENSWFSTPVEKQILFDTRVEKKWNHAAGILGIDPTMLTGQVGHS